ncbi:FecR domain-containing protein [Maribellus sp. YY47]|uniref:FecR family protein n=1 Tax=Maribellus sp. YY47 TaxID=2929486 RepID=UPI00200139BF|nr:FecR domain-containing protein [Maribellus sp. YY47]MCK3683460.1 FecR domain-containing protein [Maribellus sp. YY47]
MPDLEYEKIALLIAREISDEIDEEELRELRAWRNMNAANNALYIKLKNSQNFKSWLADREDVNVDEGWSAVYSEIKKRSRTIILRTITRIAAILVLPLFVGGVAYFYFDNQIAKKKINQQQFAQIKPGSSKATLTLCDGRDVFLDSINMLSLTEIDGTEIEKIQGEISYRKSDEQLMKQPVYNIINVPLGGEYRLTLSDGTKVYLNSMTSLKYPVQFGSDKREVELVGEAYFEVTKNAGKPFVVNTKEMKVEVLGTSFNVNAYEDSKNTVTTLVEGKVKLSNTQDDENVQILNPNEQAVMDNLSGKIALRNVDVSNYISWKDGQMVFYDMPLEEIMVLLTRWYSAKVFYMNPEVKDLRFSGSLDKYDEIEKFIDIIKATNQVNVRVNDNTILFAKK